MIDIYFAGSHCKEAEDVIENNGYCRLYSYFNDKASLSRRFLNNPPGKLFVDSGAFTAWTRGITLDVDDYIDWLNQNEKFIYLAGQIDVIPGKFRQQPTNEEKEAAAQATYENYLYMKSKLNNPNLVVYTFHLGEDYKWLAKALEDSSIEYIALGGTVGSSNKVKEQFYENCFKVIHNSNNPDVKVHAFGMTSIELLQKFPFASGDSTGGIMTGAMGNIYSDYGMLDLSEKNKNSKNSLFQLPDNYLQALRSKVESLGYSLEELATNYRSRMCYNVKYMHNKVKLLNYKGNSIKRNSLF